MNAKLEWTLDPLSSYSIELYHNSQTKKKRWRRRYHGGRTEATHTTRKALLRSVEEPPGAMRSTLRFCLAPPSFHDASEATDASHGGVPAGIPEWEIRSEPWNRMVLYIRRLFFNNERQIWLKSILLTGECCGFMSCDKTTSFQIQSQSYFSPAEQSHRYSYNDIIMKTLCVQEE